MIAWFKRFSMAMLFLFVIVLLMVLATIGINHFGDQLYKDAELKQQPMEAVK